MQNLKKIATLIAAIVIGSSTVVGAEEFKPTVKFTGPIRNESLMISQLTSPSWKPKSIFELLCIDFKLPKINELAEEKTEEVVDEVVEPKYGINLTEIREKYSNRPFVKEVLTDEVAEFLDKKEVETGIPGAVIIAQAIWEVGWDLSTAKENGKDSHNLFTARNAQRNGILRYRNGNNG